LVAAPSGAAKKLCAGRLGAAGGGGGAIATGSGGGVADEAPRNANAAIVRNTPVAIKDIHRVRRGARPRSVFGGGLAGTLD
jgi:hypothetical protein